MGCITSKDAGAGGNEAEFTVDTALPTPRGGKTTVEIPIDSMGSTSTAAKTGSATTVPPNTKTNGSAAASSVASVQEPKGSAASSASQSKPAPDEPAAVAKAARPKDSSAALSKAEQMVAQTNFKELYTLGKELGKGNYSVVHSATNKESGLEVAVKIVSKAGLDSSDVRDIKEEVSILMELDHPNIIKVYGFFEDEKYFYIVTEMMAGGELFDEIVEREFYWERDAQEVVKMLADALDYMHQRGIVHRDLKPENVLLTTKGKDGIVKLADFGFAARTDMSVSDYQLSTACGTPGYVAPEIVSGLKYGREVDMWSLGVITFILLGGYPPFHDDDQQELFRLIRRGKFHFDPAYWGLVSEEAKDCVRAMLTVDRSKRIKAGEVKDHVWIKNVPDTAEMGNTGGGVGGRGAGLDGRGPEGSVNLTPALRELKKFQARRRWKDGMAIALAREGQVFGNITSSTMMTGVPTPPRRMEDITQLSGLGTSDILTRLQMEKRQRNAQPAPF